MTMRDEIVQIIFKDWVDHVDLNDTADSILALINEERCEWLNPTWVCNVCGHVEYEEREVLCWDCGDGEMIYQPRCGKR